MARGPYRGAGLSRRWAGETVGSHDETVIELNQDAYARLRCEKELRVIPGATHLFEEPGALEQVADYAADWLKRHLQSLPVQRRAAGGAQK